MARVSEYVQIVHGLRADRAKRNATLASVGLDFSDFGAVMQRWTRAMTDDNGLGLEVARAMKTDGG